MEQIKSVIYADIFFSFLYVIFAGIVLNFEDVDNIFSDENYSTHFSIFNHGSLSASGTLICSLVPLFLLRIALDFTQIRLRGKNPIDPRHGERATDLRNKNSDEVYPEKSKSNEQFRSLDEIKFEHVKQHLLEVAKVDGKNIYVPKAYVWTGHQWRLQLTSVAFILLGLLLGIVATYKEIADEPSKFNLTDSDVKGVFKQSILYSSDFTDHCKEVDVADHTQGSGTVRITDIENKGALVYNIEDLDLLTRKNDDKKSCHRAIVSRNITQKCIKTDPGIPANDGTGFKECTVPPDSVYPQAATGCFGSGQVCDADKGTSYPIPTSLTVAKNYANGCIEGQRCTLVTAKTGDAGYGVDGDKDDHCFDTNGDLDQGKSTDARCQNNLDELFFKTGTAAETRRTALVGKTVCLKGYYIDKLANGGKGDRIGLTLPCKEGEPVPIHGNLAMESPLAGTGNYPGKLYGKNFVKEGLPVGNADTEILNWGSYNLNYTDFYDTDNEEDEKRKVNIDQDLTLSILMFFIILVFRVFDILLSYEFVDGVCKCGPRGEAVDENENPKGGPQYEKGIPKGSKNGIVFFFLIVTLGSLIHGHLQVTNHNWLLSIGEGEERGWDPERITNAREHYNGYAWENILAASFVGFHLFLALISVFAPDRTTEFMGSEYSLVTVSQHPILRVIVTSIIIGFVAVNVGRLMVFGSEITFLAAALASYFIVDVIGANHL